ncbi:hypothetical protein [Kyrpidia sp.]|uniref:hypothetical protein n=1 Tax=Kyrpidia sp. TaxID=2073077 RepID=UPI0025888D4F|nr:hypothetical protein [Kyrpidia sp.]MCL6576681.1 hypothetical protein [Kyrpidia sp.]
MGPEPSRYPLAVVVPALAVAAARIPVVAAARIPVVAAARIPVVAGAPEAERQTPVAVAAPVADRPTPAVVAAPVADRPTPAVVPTHSLSGARQVDPGRIPALPGDHLGAPL